MTAFATRRIRLADFRPGIFSDFHAGTPSVPTQSSIPANGAAVLEDTWGCCADRSGALVPLPAVTTGKTSALIPPNPTPHSTALPHTYTLDALVLDDVQESSQLPSSKPEVVTLQTFVYDVSGFGHDAYALVRRWSEFKATPDTSDVSWAKSPATNTTTDLISGNLTHARGFESTYTVEVSANTALRRGFAWVAHAFVGADNLSTRNQFISGAIPAGDQALTDYDTKYAPNFGNVFPLRLRDALYGFFPNFASPPNIFMNSGAHYDGTTDGAFWGAFMCVSHQGRVVVAQRVPSQYENRGSGLYAWKDRLSASDLLRPHVFGGAGEFVEENTTGIGTMASLSADELLVVKHGGGGYLLRGSVTAPTVTKLPFIESTYGVTSSPVATPMGLVYGSRNGVFVWDGGETSKHLSPQLDGWFWRHTSTVNYQGHSARFAWWHPWVVTPNGFAFDTRSQSWWRLDDPSTHAAYNVYAVSSRSGELFAFPWRVTGTAPTNVLWNSASPDRLAASWSWKSQPLLESTERAFKVRDVEIVATSATPNSTITVSITGFDETGVSVTLPDVTIALGSVVDRPQVLTMGVSGQDRALSYIQARVVAQAPSSTRVAPKLHSLTFDVLDTNPRAA
jgi:hypothetical protein